MSLVVRDVNIPIVETQLPEERNEDILAQARVLSIGLYTSQLGLYQDLRLGE